MLLAVMQASPPVPREIPDNPAQTAAPAKSQHPEGEQRTVRISEPVTVSVAKDWADWGVWVFSGLLVVVGAFQAILMFGTLRTITQQTAILERQLRKERAHIRIDLKHLQLDEPDEGAKDTVQIIRYVVSFYGSTYAFVDEDVFETRLSDSPEIGDWRIDRR
jgi:hypothetical protein